MIVNTSTYLKRDVQHFLASIGVLAPNFLFYLKFGFYGWHHFAGVLLAWYAAASLDDWLEKKRSFPFYILIPLGGALYLEPLITLVVLLGNGIANLQAILNRNNFWLERLEGLGNALVFTLPFILPLQTLPFSVYPAVALFLLFADSIHKIGHRETKQPRKLWITSFISMAILAIVFATPTIAFATLVVTLLLSLIPFTRIRDAKQSWLYTQFWFGLAGFLAYYYYLFVVLP